jgi:hypothetical protein
MDKECYIYGREGTCATLSNAPLRYESIWTPCQCDIPSM